MRGSWGLGHGAVGPLGPVFGPGLIGLHENLEGPEKDLTPAPRRNYLKISKTYSRERTLAYPGLTKKVDLTYSRIK